jgi:multidrug resistance efflux pump
MIKKMEQEKEYILRSEEVSEVLTKPPRWIVRWGITIIFLLLVLSVTISFFIEYPDTIEASAEVTAINPPVYLVANSSGSLQYLLVGDKQNVSANQVIGVVENTSNYHHVLMLEARLDSIINQLDSLNKITDFRLENLQLGDLTTPYLQFINSLRTYELFIQTNAQQKEIAALKKQQKEYANLQKMQKGQKILQEQELELKQKDFERHKNLLEDGAISKAEFETKKSEYIAAQRSFENQDISISGTSITMAGIEKNRVQLELASSEQNENLKAAMVETRSKLKAAILTWKQSYLIISPTEGQLEFINLWKENQRVEANTQLFVVTPNNSNEYVAKLIMPSANAGKVAIDQQVNIELENFNSTEFGMLIGEVVSVSQIPIDGNYSVNVRLPNGLVTNYQKQLPARALSNGKGTIITEKRKLFDRIVLKFRKMLG